MKVKLEEMSDFAEEFISKIEKTNTARVFGLSGNLGAGKTTFTQLVAKSLGVEDAITSPTFVIMKSYDLGDKRGPRQSEDDGMDFDKLIHIDAYRLESGKELEVLGFEELTKDPKNLILLEWPEKVSEILPKEMTTIKFEVVDEETRDIDIEKN